MIAVLHTARGFGEVAHTLARHELTLCDVRACTFPGRPEPRSARWVTATALDFLRYRYEPDLDVRLLWQLTPCTTFGAPAHHTLDDVLRAGVPDEAPWFELWSDLHDDLLGDVHQRAQRAAMAWRLRGELLGTQEEGALCEAMLVEALSLGGVSARRASAEQLMMWPREAARRALTQTRAEDPDVEVRLHAHRALERLDARALTTSSRRR